ncbi:MAG: threonine/serine exporter family protein [Treponema sp.]|nr:threonine/serine exporter family protein [Treponema sp.]
MPAPLEPLWAAVATAGFALLFNLRRRDVPIAALGAALGWAVYMLVSSVTAAQAVGLFAAAAVIGLWAEFVAAFLRRPASVYIVCAIIPLVPGGGMYYTMLASVKGQTWNALTTGLATLQAAGAIAAGLALSGAFARLLSLRRLAGKWTGPVHSRRDRPRR